DALGVPPGEPVDLAGLDPRATPLAPGGKKKTADAMAADGVELARLQEALFASGDRRVLVVLQGMDTSGKGGVIEHVIGLVNPQGVHIHSFKKPTAEELRHHFLWRVRRLATPQVVEKRYSEIARFEGGLADQGYALVKCFLNISYDEQRERLLARLEDPDKHWKFNEGDLAERQRWGDYQKAYRIALERCSTPQAPWYAVPADRKWYRNWAIGRLLLETVRELDPRFPHPDLDVKALTKALAPPN